MPDELLEGFSCGVGIAHGRAVAGQIGTAQQAKIGVFGPVVNQGSRIEGLTRMFGVNVCVDEATANFVRKLLPASEGCCRRLANVRPKGMDVALLVSELLPPEGYSPTTAAVANLPPMEPPRPAADPCAAARAPAQSPAARSRARKRLRPGTTPSARAVAATAGSPRDQD